MSKGSSKPYAIGYDEEHERLERQARIGKIEDHLKKFSFSTDAVILDTGCGLRARVDDAIAGEGGARWQSSRRGYERALLGLREDPRAR